MTRRAGLESGHAAHGDERLIVGLVSALILAFHAALFLPLLNATSVPMGHDYAYVLPNLLAGYFWFHNNGLSSLPWFTPAFCGGLPFYANPQVGYLSITQFLTFAVNPVAALCLTFTALAAIGYGGTYVLLSRGFGVNRWAALVGASVFAFNGFVVYRVLIGHLAFGYFALVPLCAACLIVPSGTAVATTMVAAMLAAALLIAAMIQAGIGSILLPALLSILLVLVVHSVARGFRFKPYLWFAAAAVAGACLSAAKINASLEFLHQFSREQYPLPGYDSLWHSAVMAFRALFLGPPETENLQWERNAVLGLGRHELEFGMSVVPLGLALIACLEGASRVNWAFCVSRARGSGVRFWLPKPSQFVLWLVLALLATLPIALNWYQADWNAILKRLPIVGSSSTLIRWFCLYIPAVSVSCALAMQRIGRHQIEIAALALAALLGTNAAADKQFYRSQPYDPAPILKAYEDVKSGRVRPNIDNIEMFVDQSGRIQIPFYANDALAGGNSPMVCYEPIFGYASENFPLGLLRPGPALSSYDDRHLNLKNPSCYVFPTANACMPGDHFRVSERLAASAFAGYRSFPFRVSAAQRLANDINVIALIVALGLGAWLATERVTHWIKRRGG
jgi:hypothetical protein